jgi:hypothetical protein
MNVSSWTDIVQVAAGEYHTVGLKSDGTVVAVGDNTYGQTHTNDWTDIVQIAAGKSFTLGLKSDGTVVATGRDNYGQCDLSDWNLNYCPPTLITLSSFAAESQSGEVLLQWTTAAEIDNAGFNIYRAESENGEYEQINETLISAKGSPTQGASYEYVDTDVQNRKTYYYKLEDIYLNGVSTFHGPVRATPRVVRNSQ